MAEYLKEFSNLGVIAPVTDGIAGPTEAASVVNEERPFVGIQRQAVVDGQQANANTKEFKFPLPDFEDNRRQLAGERYYADLDLSKAFYQIPLAKGCQYLTTFVADDRLYYYKLTATLAPLVDMGMMPPPYLDDIKFAADSLHELRSLAFEVCGLLDQHQWTVNMDKSAFGTEIQTLGLTVNRNGISTPKKKARGLRPPRNYT